VHGFSPCFHCLSAYASNHLSVTLLPVWRPLPPCINPCCHVTPSHFSFLFCIHVLTPVHPSVSILYKCMVLRLSCLSSQFPYFVIAISHLFTYHLLSASVLPPFPLSHSRTYLRSLFFYLLVVRCSASHKLRMYDVC
jgi:hypothetical protein